MFRKTWTLLALAAVGSMVFANVDLRTNIQDIYYRGTCEEAGAVTMSVNGDDFYEASTETPVFIRIRLDKGGLLCDTLVDYNGIDVDGFLHVNRPIYLAMRLEGGTATLAQIAAPAQTVSIVRWIEGEPELWLRVQAASTNWINFGGTLVAPDIQLRVAWTFGVTARNSYDRNYGPYLAMRSNLPANTFDTVSIMNIGTEQGYAISTLFCVDVSESILTPMPQLNSALMFDTISYDYTTDGVFDQGSSTSIITGNQTSANFSGDDTIARGFDISCSISFEKRPTEDAALCLEPGGQQGQDEGLVCIDGAIEINVYCDYGFNYASQFHFVLPAGAAYGFPILLDADGDPIGSGLVDSNGDALWAIPISAAITRPAGVVQGWIAGAFQGDVFVAGGHFLANYGLLYYIGADVNSTSVDIEINATICMWYDNPATDVMLQIALFLSNRGSTYDSAPFNGTLDNPNTVSAADQRAHCPASYLFLGPIDWAFGEFTECLSDRVSIFFPYLPKLVDTDYWTGISIVNQGLISFADGEVMGNIYEADGSLWQVEFPPLPVRNQYTWLVTDGDQGVGFYDSDAGIFLPVTAGGGDLVPMDLRSSMFVYAQAQGETIYDIMGPDLDGFCLIGNVVTLVVYGYLPRNTEMDPLDAWWLNGQTGDLPILRTKQAPVFNRDITIMREVNLKETLR